MDFTFLLTCFLANMTAKNISTEALEAFDTCENIENLIDEVALRINITEGDSDKAATFILTNLNIQEKFEVMILDSFHDRGKVVEGGLSFDKAEKLANKLWESDKYYGVEIVDSDQDNMEPVVWAKSKYAKQGEN